MSETGRKRKRPKKVLPAYLFFSMMKRPEIKREFPALSFGEIAAKVGEAWAELDEAGRRPFEEMRAIDTERYAREYASIPQPVLKRRKSKDAPKFPLSAYSHYLKATHPAIRAANPTSEFTYLSAMVGEQWRGLSDEERAKFTAMAAVDRTRYENEVKAWQARHCATAGGQEGSAAIRSQMILLVEGEGPEVPPLQKPPPKKPSIKAPLSAYNYFVAEQRASAEGRAAVVDGVKETFHQVTARLASQWKSLSLEERRKYAEKATVDKQRFAREKEAHAASILLPPPSSVSSASDFIGQQPTQYPSDPPSPHDDELSLDCVAGSGLDVQLDSELHRQTDEGMGQEEEDQDFMQEREEAEEERRRQQPRQLQEQTPPPHHHHHHHHQQQQQQQLQLQQQPYYSSYRDETVGDREVAVQLPEKVSQLLDHVHAGHETCCCTCASPAAPLVGDRHEDGFY
jgi:hypothetical protein